MGMMARHQELLHHSVAGCAKVMPKVWMCGDTVWSKGQVPEIGAEEAAVHFLSKQEKERIGFCQLQSSSLGMGAPALCVFNLLELEHETQIKSLEPQLRSCKEK